MKDNGKRANRSALIMRRTSRAKAEDFWFILLNSPVAWEDSRFNCSWFWEALASEEVKWFTRIGTYSGLHFWGSLFSKLAKGGTDFASWVMWQFRHLSWAEGKMGWALADACKLSALPDKVVPFVGPYCRQHLPYLKVPLSPALT